MNGKSRKRNRMYHEFAHLWPLISPPEEYVEEAKHWKKTLRDKLGPGRHEILELGVGGGHNLSHLTSEFKATGIDISSRMLANSMKLNPNVEHHLGDMRSVRLGHRFKAVLIHDAISYLVSEAEIAATFDTARAHLEPGGVLVISPDWFRETFPGTYISSEIKRREGNELGLVEYWYDADPEDTTLEGVFVYIFEEEGRLRVEHDPHVTGLFPLQTWLELMRDAGFEVEKRPYPVHTESWESYLLVGVLRNG